MHVWTYKILFPKNKWDWVIKYTMIWKIKIWKKKQNENICDSCKPYQLRFPVKGHNCLQNSIENFWTFQLRSEQQPVPLSLDFDWDSYRHKMIFYVNITLNITIKWGTGKKQSQLSAVEWSQHMWDFRILCN